MHCHHSSWVVVPQVAVAVVAVVAGNIAAGCFLYSVDAVVVAAADVPAVVDPYSRQDLKALYSFGLNTK